MKSSSTMTIGLQQRRRPWLVRSRAWISILIIAPFAAITALSRPIVAEDTLADFVLDAAGWVCFAAGAAFRWWATLYVGGRKERELLVDGPYSITRNPLYFGSFLLTLSIAFFLHSPIFALGIVVATPLYLWVTIPWEESRLLDRFGEPFDQYRQRVPKFLPAFSRFQSPPIVNTKIAGLMVEYRIALRWMWVPLLAEGVAHLQTETWWPAVVWWR